MGLINRLIAEGAPSCRIMHPRWKNGSWSERCTKKGGFLKWGISKSPWVSILKHGHPIRPWRLDDLGYPQDLGNLHSSTLSFVWSDSSICQPVQDCDHHSFLTLNYDFTIPVISICMYVIAPSIYEQIHVSDSFDPDNFQPFNQGSFRFNIYTHI